MRISMVIPAFGEQSHLDQSLETIEPQRFQLHEIIVVDDGTPEPLKVPDWVALLRIERDPKHRGSSFAKNYGAKAASGDQLLFADSDILHLSDAVASIKKASETLYSKTLGKVILNTVRYSIPEGYPASYLDDLDAFYQRCEIGGVVPDPDMKNNMTRGWEQNFGMIEKEFFWKIGGYDAEGFPSWGFNNHDLCMRVVQDGGYISSTIPRVSTGKRLCCFHLWHDNGCSPEKARGEFKARWGETFTHQLSADLFQRKMEDHIL